MKKTVIFLLALLLAIPALAVPARPGTHKYTQPDGTVIVLQNHGDEYYNWTTNADGQTVELGADGFYRPVSTTDSEHRSRARMARSRSLSNQAPALAANASSMSTGTHKILCILANFSDMTFSFEKGHFEDMLNLQGYSYNGAFGSVHDYYYENSGGQYDPQFEVFGPVNLSGKSADYDKDANGYYHVDQAIFEAYNKLSGQINLSDYDSDNDGFVDMVLFYYPGYNEAEGGPTNTIWPHQGYSSYSGYGSFGNSGKKLNRYFCTSELSGSEGGVAASIGTTCHEFAHSLGLPDFYDTDYETNGKNAMTTGSFDLMSSGNYNDDGRRPPYLSALERNMLGWLDDPQTISDAGSYELKAIQNSTGTRAYRINSQTSGEYFLLECRTGERWDKYIGDLGAKGLMVYHVDKSNNTVPGTNKHAYQLWNSNDINDFGGHPCYYVISPSGNHGSFSDYVLPGTGPVNSYTLTGWNGNAASAALAGVSFDGTKVTFSIPPANTRVIEGDVRDVQGNPIEGATVTLSRSPYTITAPTRLSTDVVHTTDAAGHFTFTLGSSDPESQVLSVRKAGYVSEACNLVVSNPASQVNFVLLTTIGEEPPASLQKYDSQMLYTGYYRAGFATSSQLGSSSSTYSTAAGTLFSANELSVSGAIGSKISSVSFLPGEGSTSWESLYVIVDIGGNKNVYHVASQVSSGQFVTVDLSDKDLVIPVGKDVYIGFGMAGIQKGKSPFCMVGPLTNATTDMYRMPDFLNDNAEWDEINFSDGVFALVISASVSPASETSFSSFGVSFIQLENGVPQVVPAAGKTVQGTAWSLDGTALEGEPTAATVSGLAPGAHTFMARLSYYDGTFERVYYDMIKE